MAAGKQSFSLRKNLDDASSLLSFPGVAALAFMLGPDSPECISVTAPRVPNLVHLLLDKMADASFR